jgi:hypothetical protein
MREIRTSGLMSGDGKRSVAAWPKLTAPILDSTIATDANALTSRLLSSISGHKAIFGANLICSE